MSESERDFDEAVERAAADLVSRRFSVTILAITTALTLFLIIGILYPVRAIENMFMEMNIEGGLPTLTQIALSPGPMLLLLVILVAGVAKEFLIKNYHTRMLINTLHLAAVLAIGALMGIAMFMPLIELKQQMG